MLRKAIWALVAAVCLAAPVAVQAQGNYLDVTIVKVKPEKSAEFNAIARKIADANRRNNGDRWLAQETIYGEGDTFVFTSARQDYADVDKGNDAFMGALQKAYGKEGTQKMMHDLDSYSLSVRSELRRRRPDLSRKAPTDMASYAKLIGESRVLRTTVVHVRPGHNVEFEALLKEAKEAGEKIADTQPVLVSQAVEGTSGPGTTFYITALRSSMGGFDKNPTIREILGEDGYKKYLQVNAEAVESTQSSLLHFSPELSNPLEEIAQVAADFWTPKAIVASASPKAMAKGGKAAEMTPTSEKPKP
jgi:hypothetical protein